MNKKYLGLALFGVTSIAFASVTGSLLPTGAGNYSAWTPSSGATHYTLVDEATCNGTTDYVSTVTVGARDSFAVSLASIPNGALITGITITPCASKTKNSGSGVMSVFYRLNGVDSANSASYNLSGQTPVALTGANYLGLATIKTATTTLEAGAVLNSGASGARLSRIQTVITYVTDPVVPTNVVSVASSTGIALTWSSSSADQDSFSIEKSTDGINFSVASTTGGTTRLYKDLGLAPGTYYYKIRSHNAIGYSGYSSTTSTTLP